MKKYRVILKSGAALPDFACEGCDVERDKFTGIVCRIYITGAEAPNPVYIDVNEVAAVVELYDDPDKPREDPCKVCGYRAYYEQVSKQNDCNDCGKGNSCEHRPPLGGLVRINCPLWAPKQAEVRK